MFFRVGVKDVSVTADMDNIGLTRWGLQFGAYLLQYRSGKFIQYLMFPW